MLFRSLELHGFFQNFLRTLIFDLFLQFTDKTDRTGTRHLVNRLADSQATPQSPPSMFSDEAESIQGVRPSKKARRQAMEDWTDDEVPLSKKQGKRLLSTGRGAAGQPATARQPASAARAEMWAPARSGKNSS